MAVIAFWSQPSDKAVEPMRERFLREWEEGSRNAISAIESIKMRKREWR